MKNMNGDSRMKDKNIHRTCTVCLNDRRTTISKDEEAIYICEICLRNEVRDAWLEKGDAKKLAKSMAWMVMLIIFVVGILLGKFVF